MTDRVTATVTAPTCSYCFKTRGTGHQRWCVRPGGKAEDDAATLVAVLEAPRCAACGAMLVSGRCAVDWCPSTAMERKAAEAGASIGIALRWMFRIARGAIIGILTIVVFRVMGWWP